MAQLQLSTITNYVYDDQLAGISLPGTDLLKQPVIGSTQRQPWIIAQRNGSAILSIGPYVAISESDGVWGVLPVVTSATEWAITPSQQGMFIITDSATRKKAWTLLDENSQVSLEYAQDGRFLNQLWKIEPWLD